MRHYDGQIERLIDQSQEKLATEGLENVDDKTAIYALVGYQIERLETAIKEGLGNRKNSNSNRRRRDTVVRLTIPAGAAGAIVALVEILRAMGG